MITFARNSEPNKYMAILKLTNKNIMISKLRKAYKKANLTMRIWGDQIVVSGWPKYKDPKSQKQISCRNRFREAQVLMMADFCRVGSIKYWTKKAKQNGYKTAKGCARAYYYNELKIRDSYAECKNGKVYNVELIPLKDIVKKSKLKPYDLNYSASQKRRIEKRLKQLIPQLETISNFTWDYQFLIDSPPEWYNTTKRET